MDSPLLPDLERSLATYRPALEALRGARLFLTGGTGFFGCWLLETLAFAADRLGLDVETVVLTRDPERFRAKRPHLAGHRTVRLLRGDVRDFSPPPGPFSLVIHGAAPAGARASPETARELRETIVEGTRRVLGATRGWGVRRLLLVSSGAVYGRQPAGLARVPEDHGGMPDPADPASAYGEGKRAAESLCVLHGREAGFDALMARCFAFVGPYLPLDGPFAVGNFIRDALRGGPIVVTGDGTPRRSYLYGADLAGWLLTILARGAHARTYHVGSEADLGIADLARLVARILAPGAEVRVLATAIPGASLERYVPSTARTRAELGLAEGLGLEDAIRRTAAFHASSG